MKANIGIAETHLQSVAKELNMLLADEVVLYFKIRNYHWNVEGSNFNELHLFYEAQYNQLDMIMDEVAERIRMIGHYAEGRLVDYLKITNLIEQPYTIEQGEQIADLLSSHETLIRNLRRLVPLFNETHKDAGSGDFVTQLLGRHEKMAWMLRAYFR